MEATSSFEGMPRELKILQSPPHTLLKEIYSTTYGNLLGSFIETT
jgi:hypothetical protein